ncbi:hypothetical protein ES703_28674 [subsurface metagenome]
MFKCVVQMFGLPREITDLQEVELQLKEGATLKEFITALRNKIPSLEGTVIREGQLADFYTFYVNGHFYFGDRDIQLRNGDHVALLRVTFGG